VWVQGNVCNSWRLGARWWYVGTRNFPHLFRAGLVLAEHGPSILVKSRHSWLPVSTFSCLAHQHPPNSSPSYLRRRNLTSVFLVCLWVSFLPSSSLTLDDWCVHPHLSPHAHTTAALYEELSLHTHTTAALYEELSSHAHTTAALYEELSSHAHITSVSSLAPFLSFPSLSGFSGNPHFRSKLCTATAASQHLYFCCLQPLLLRSFYWPWPCFRCVEQRYSDHSFTLPHTLSSHKTPNTFFQCIRWSISAFNSPVSLIETDNADHRLETICQQRPTARRPLSSINARWLTMVIMMMGKVMV